MSQFDIVFGGTPSQSIDMIASGGSPWTNNTTPIPIYATRYTDTSYLMLPFPAASEWDALRAEYEARIEAVATEALVVPGSNQDYASWVTDFDALDPGEKALPIMTNLEFTYWTAILGAEEEGPDGTNYVNPSWRTDPEVLTEFTRYNTKHSTSWDAATATLAQFKTVAEELWQDTAAYGLANGCPHIVPYSGSVLPNQGNWSYGVPPMMIRRSTSQPSDISYYLENAQFVPSMYSASGLSGSHPWTNDAGAAKSVARAHKGHSAFCQAIYCFLPTSGRGIENIESWTDGILERRVNGVVTPSPSFIGADFRTWMGRWTLDTVGFNKTKILNVIDVDPTIGTDFPGGHEVILYLGATPPDIASAANYMQRNFLCNVYDTTPEDRADLLYLSAFFEQSSVLDEIPRQLPTAFWVWDSAEYWTETLMMLQVYSPGPPEVYRLRSLNARYGFERTCLGRAHPTIANGAPFGSNDIATPTTGAPDGTNGGVIWNFLYNNTMPESTWYNNSGWWPNVKWHDPSTGSQLPGGLTLQGTPEDGHALAPYLDFDNEIWGPDVRRAKFIFEAEYRVKQLERLRYRLNEYQGITNP